MAVVVCYHRSMRKRRRKGGVPPGTYETRLRLDEGESAALHSYACLFSKLERKLFSRLQAGGAVADLKREYLRECGIPARMFNSVHASLRGKVVSRRESLALQRDMLATAIQRAELVREKGELRSVHHKQRRLESLRFRLARVEQDIAEGRVRLCFGSRKLFRAQHHLKANGYGDHEEWLAEWRRRRDDSLFVLGSRDETGGCQACVATVAEDGSVTLRLRLPGALEKEHGTYLVFEGLHFNHGHPQVLAALDSCREYWKYRREHPGERQRDVPSWLGQAVSYRFKLDAKGWRVLVTVAREEVPLVTDSRRGAVGVDLNEDHLAVSETDGSGNWVHSFSVPLVTHGKTSRQAEALTGDAVARVVEYARSVGKPIAYEELDFRGKKASLEGESPRRSRMLSSFAYGRFREYLMSRGHREGVEVVGVNPAFSSIVGRVKFMERYGLTVHQAASLVLARRIPGCSERIPRRWVCPDGRGGHVAFAVPVRKRAKHVGHLYRMTGVDLTRIDGVDGLTALRVISEVGADMTRWASAKHFASWLGLSPHNRITGGKVISSKTKASANRAAALRLAANALHRSDSALGAFLRRKKAHLGAPKAITATAHKLARLIYSMLRYGQEYVDAGADYYESQYRHRALRAAKQRATQLGYQLVPMSDAQPSGLPHGSEAAAP